MFISSCRIYTNRNFSQILPNATVASLQSSNISDGEWIINSISLLIFILSSLGNTAALVVMFGSRGPIRLTNNKYLVNLACADLLRACFMPFTIIARVKRNFMFGPIICKVLPIVQGLSVAVDVFTLVCISVERYIAICRPLLILKLQSLRFANFFNGLILFLIWTLSLLSALPNIPMYNLCSLPKPGKFKCEKVNPQYFDERYYMVVLDVFYFLAPMLIMLVLYTLIICKMYKNNTALRMRSFQNSNNHSKSHSTSSSPPTVRRNSCIQHDLVDQKLNSKNEIAGRMSFQSNKSKSGISDDEHGNSNHRKRSQSNPPFHQICKEQKRSYCSRSGSNRSQHSSNRGTYRVDRHRRKALKLLIVIIVEFFVCWTPLFIYHTFGTFDKKFYRSMPTIFVDLILLFSFASALSNPLTYYFMSKRYRSVLYAYLTCCYWNKDNEKLNKKSQEARQMIRALHLHQQQNILEYKQKVTKPVITSSNNMLYHPKFRSNTVQ
ncbi:unnamed protein product [Adineta steineri]|uniref:G-protein coupled receptors family 1 profile domain-containing protein n=1 Tax=Adineta steineri TaxID=433720 RepID=A0A818RZP7_9BILA|nr:unnamed protein product [Adineta steineri]CAF3664579.1 unnamed protein product [Adineta steineri]